MAIVIPIVNQKGGVSKTSTCVNLGIGLARYGKKVLVVDADSQGSLTACLGFGQLKELPETLATIMSKVICEMPINPSDGVLHHNEGVYLLPADADLASMEMKLVSVMSRETILREYINLVRPDYDYILIDCQPSLGMITVNALAAGDSIIIPVQAEFLAAKGLEQLLKTIAHIRRRINTRLNISGILMTMVNDRTNDAREIIDSVKNAYGTQIHIYTSIPRSVKISEISKQGISIYAYAPSSKVAAAYDALTNEVLANEK